METNIIDFHDIEVWMTLKGVGVKEFSILAPNSTLRIKQKYKYKNPVLVYGRKFGFIVTDYSNIQRYVEGE